MGANLFSAFNANISGLSGVTKSVGAYAQNIASQGAVGSKERRAFHSVVNTGSTVDSFSPSGITTGMQHFISKQGDLAASDIPTNMAIQGSGFFVVNNNPAGQSSGGTVSFTRNGSFEEDKNGNFRNAAGQYLQIFKTDANGVPLSTNLTSTSQMVTASSQGLSGKPTPSTQVKVRGINLSSTAQVGTISTLPVQIWDSLGVNHTINLNFTKTAASPGTWNVRAAGALPGDVTSFDTDYTAPGFDIVFDANGDLASINGASAIAPANNTPPMTITWSSTAAVSNLAMDFGSIGPTGGIKATGNSPDFSTPVDVNGRGSGKYVRTDIDPKTGYLKAIFDGNDSLIYGKVPLGIFKNPNQLLEQTGGIFMPTNDSGTPIINFVGNGGAGELAVGNLESSTIDSASAFTGLIVEQQRYTTNLTCISTVKEMLTALTRTLGG